MANTLTDELIIFQSTLPAWGETPLDLRLYPRRVISIHSPRMGRDLLRLLGRDLGVDFNPLSPHGERRNTST